MQAVISSWLNLVKTIFKPENETINRKNDHLRHLKFAENCVQEMKKILPLRKVIGSTSRKKQREGQRKNKIFFNNL